MFPKFFFYHVRELVVGFVARMRKTFLFNRLLGAKVPQRAIVVKTKEQECCDMLKKHCRSGDHLDEQQLLLDLQFIQFHYQGYHALFEEVRQELAWKQSFRTWEQTYGQNAEQVESDNEDDPFDYWVHYLLTNNIDPTRELIFRMNQYKRTDIRFWLIRVQVSMKMPI